MRLRLALVTALPLACADGLRAASDASAPSDTDLAEQALPLTFDMPAAPLVRPPAPLERARAAAPSDPMAVAPVSTPVVATVLTTESVRVVPEDEPERTLAVPEIRGEILASTAAVTRLERAGEWVGVAVAEARHDVLAVWSDRHISLTVDDGAHFTPVLKRLRLLGGQSVAMMGDGTLLALGKGRRLGVRTPDGDETTRTLPFLRAGGTLMAAGDRIGWLGPKVAEPGFGEQQVLALSAGRAEPWRLVAAPDPGNDVNQPSLRPDGTVALLRASSASCGGGWEDKQVLRANQTEWEPAPAAFEVIIAGVSAGPTWSYAFGTACARTPDTYSLCAYREESAQAVTGIGLPADYDHWTHTFLGASAPPAVAETARFEGALVVDHFLALVTGPTATVVDTEMPPEPSAVAVDGAGRVVAIGKGHLFRWSHASGWRIL